MDFGLTADLAALSSSSSSSGDFRFCERDVSHHPDRNTARIQAEGMQRERSQHFRDIRLYTRENPTVAVPMLSALLDGFRPPPMPGVRDFQHNTHLGHIHRLHRPNRIKRPEPVSLVTQQAMHVPDMHEIVLVFRGNADGVFPFVNELTAQGKSASEETTGQRIQR
jgi:hypothetical protein